MVCSWFVEGLESMAWDLQELREFRDVGEGVMLERASGRKCPGQGAAAGFQKV
jgi:hypothetical protein